MSVILSVLAAGGVLLVVMSILYFLDRNWQLGAAAAGLAALDVALVTWTIVRLLERA